MEEKGLQWNTDTERNRKKLSRENKKERTKKTKVNRLYWRDQVDGRDVSRSSSLPPVCGGGL